MAYELAAIPTEYKGVQLKSRMEAQCAFLFDQLGWKWEYEPSSIMLSSGVTFTPDFTVGEFGELIVECRGYENKRGSAQIAGYIADLPSQAIKRDEAAEFLVMGPDECIIYCATTEGRTHSHQARLTFCVRCDGWSFHEKDQWEPLCPRCVQLTFNDYPLTVKDGKFFMRGVPFEDAADQFSRENQIRGWLCNFYEHTCLSLGRWELLRGPQSQEGSDLFRSLSSIFEARQK